MIPAQGARWMMALLCVSSPFLAAIANAQLFIVETTTLSSMKQAVRTYLQRIDLDTGTIAPTGYTLPGSSATTIPCVSLDGDLIAVSTAGSAGPLQISNAAYRWTNVYESFPLRPLVLDANTRFNQAPLFAGCWGRDPVTNDRLLIELSAQSNDSDANGETKVIRVSPGARHGALAATWPLPGVPVSATLLNGRGRVAFLCRSKDSDDAVVHIRDVITGQVHVEALPLAFHRDPDVASQPHSIIAPRDSHVFCVVTAGQTGATQQSGPRISLELFDSERFSPVGVPLTLEGELGSHAWLTPTPTSIVLAVHRPALAVATISRLELTVDGFTVAAERPFADVDSQPLLAMTPNNLLAAALGSRVELLKLNSLEGSAVDCPGSLQALVATPSGVACGIANRVFTIDAESRALVERMAVQTGKVTNFWPIDRARIALDDLDIDRLDAAAEGQVGTSPTAPDTDSDGLDDSVDPAPLAPSPRLEAPALITFRGEAAGHELKAIELQSSFPVESNYQIDINADDTSWLKVFPPRGPLPAVIYLGVNPRLLASQSNVGTTGAIDVHVFANGVAVFESPTNIPIDVLPTRSDVLRILWLTKSSTELEVGKPAEYGQLASTLERPPYYASHDRAGGVLVDSFTPYSIIVLDADIALAGALTRQELLEYVAGGGLLIFVAHHTGEAEARLLQRWLSPAGLHINTAEQVNGVFPVRASLPLSLTSKSISIQDGASIRTTGAAKLFAGKQETADYGVLAGADYGWGRIVAIASPTPLNDSALSSADGTFFVLSLFDWLLRAPRDLQDLDSDGLSDATEDQNQNSMLDRGETNRFNNDTDRDGVPDGFEDINRNGQVDPGETSPLNPDSDGDGTWDGADVSPAPPGDAPIIAFIQPDHGAAEGGQRVLVSGQNFSPDSQLWFGNRQARNARSGSAETIVAEVPASEEYATGPVDIRVVNPSSERSGSMPAGFRYDSRGIVTLSINSIGKAGSTYEGDISIHLESTASTRVARISFQLEVDPVGALRWDRVYPGEMARFSGRRVVQRPSPLRGLFIDISEGRRDARQGEVARIAWTRMTPTSAQPLTLRLQNVHALAPNGEQLEVRVVEETIVNDNKIGAAAEASATAPRPVS